MEYIKTLKYSIKRKANIIDKKINYFQSIPLMSWIEISPIDACNRKCSFCPKSDEKLAPDTFYKMGISTIKKLSIDLEKIGFKGTIVFAGYGEPLLNKKLDQMVNVLSKICNVEITTNGDPLTVNRINQLIDAGISKIVVSLYDGPHQIKKFKDLFIKSNAKPKHFILRDRWYNEEDGFGLMLTNRAGTLNYENKNLPHNFEKKCFYPHYSMMIDWDGSVFLCTQDWQRKVSSGNINNQHILDIWNSELLKKYRTNLSCGKRSENPCKSCNANGTLHGENSKKAWDKYYLKI